MCSMSVAVKYYSNRNDFIIASQALAEWAKAGKAIVRGYNDDIGKYELIVKNSLSWWDYFFNDPTYEIEQFYRDNWSHLLHSSEILENHQSPVFRKLGPLIQFLERQKKEFEDNGIVFVEGVEHKQQWSMDALPFELSLARKEFEELFPATKSLFGALALNKEIDPKWCTRNNLLDCFFWADRLEMNEVRHKVLLLMKHDFIMMPHIIRPPGAYYAEWLSYYLSPEDLELVSFTYEQEALLQRSLLAEKEDIPRIQYFKAKLLGYYALNSTKAQHPEAYTILEKAIKAMRKAVLRGYCPQSELTKFEALSYIASGARTRFRKLVDPVFAFSNATEAAKDGDPQGLYDLAVCYHEGFGVRRDDEVALAYLTRAKLKAKGKLLADIEQLVTDLTFGCTVAPTVEDPVTSFGHTQAKRDYTVICRNGAVKIASRFAQKIELFFKHRDFTGRQGIQQKKCINLGECGIDCTKKELRQLVKLFLRTKEVVSLRRDKALRLKKVAKFLGMDPLAELLERGIQSRTSRLHLFIPVSATIMPHLHAEISTEDSRIPPLYYVYIYTGKLEGSPQDLIGLYRYAETQQNELLKKRCKDALKFYLLKNPDFRAHVLLNVVQAYKDTKCPIDLVDTVMQSFPLEDFSLLNQNDGKAMFDVCNQMADRGCPAAQTALALCYAFGKGVAGDKEKGVEWLEKARAQNFALGIYVLGGFYLNGWVGGFSIENDTRGQELINEAARRGCQRAISVNNRSLNPRNFYPADRGNGLALRQRSLYFYARRRYDKAFEHAQQALDMGSKQALVDLGTFYYRGHGVAQDRDRALQLLTLAVDLKVEGAASVLENLVP